MVVTCYELTEKVQENTRVLNKHIKSKAGNNNTGLILRKNVLNDTLRNCLMANETRYKSCLVV